MVELLSKEAMADIQSCCIKGDRNLVRHWLLIGDTVFLPNYPQSLIDEVQAEIDKENGLSTNNFTTEILCIL